MQADTFFKLWLKEQQLHLEKSTYEAYQTYILKHIAPYYSGLPLEDLRASHVNAYCREKLRSGRCDWKSGGLSLVSVRKHLSVTKQALNDAVILGYIQSNPALAVRLPRKKSGLTDRTVLMSAEEAKRVLDAFRSSFLYPAVALALYYGLRRSEVCGLRWSAIDFDANTICICHTVVKGLTIEAKDRTKTETSRRTYQLLPEVRDMLLRLPRTSPYVLTLGGGFLRPDTVTRTFSKVLKRAGLPHMRFHDLRHSTASILFDLGFELEDVKQWLGHSDIDTTSNIYLHYNRKRTVLIADRLCGLFL